MKAQIKAILSPDIADLPHYLPEDAEVFGVALQLLIGPENQPGMESFQITVCSPQWLASQLKKQPFLPGRHYLFTLEYNYAGIVQFLESSIAGCNGKNWSEIAEKLSRLGYWEFEDYTESVK